MAKLAAYVAGAEDTYLSSRWRGVQEAAFAAAASQIGSVNPWLSDSWLSDS